VKKSSSHRLWAIGFDPGTLILRAFGNLALLYGNGLGGTNLEATLATQALIHVHHLGFAVFDLEHSHRAGIRAFPFAVTFLLIHGYDIHSFSFTSSIWIQVFLS